MQNFRKLSTVLLGLILILTTACGKKLPELTGIDWEAWQADRNGCDGIRTPTIDTLAAQKNLLLGLTEMDIIKVLGKPDKNEPYKRNQKFFYYFLEPGEMCNQAQASPTYLQLRFNAMGLAKEAMIQQ